MQGLYSRAMARWENRQLMSCEEPGGQHHVRKPQNQVKTIPNHSKPRLLVNLKGPDTLSPTRALLGRPKPPLNGSPKPLSARAVLSVWIPDRLRGCHMAPTGSPFRPPFSAAVLGLLHCGFGQGRVSEQDHQAEYGHSRHQGRDEQKAQGEDPVGQRLGLRTACPAGRSMRVHA